MEILQKFYELLKYHNRPWSTLEFTYIVGIEVIVLIVCAVLLYKKKIRWFQMLAMLLLWPYLAAVLQSCVFTRPYREPSVELNLFWSWKLALSGDRYYFQQVFLNILLLMPAGMLLPFCLGKPCPIWKSLLFGLFCSLFVESLQYILGRGLFELDDLLDNTLGCLMGTTVIDIIWLLCRGIRTLFRKLISRT